MNRRDLKVLADDRVADAGALLEAGRWSAAYYLLGYGVECAFKACIAKQFLEHEIPEKALVNGFYTHRLDNLLVISRLRDILASKVATDVPFQSKLGHRRALDRSVPIRSFNN